MLEFTAFLVAAVENLAVSTAARAKFISPVTSSAAPVRKKTSPKSRDQPAQPMEKVFKIGFLAENVSDKFYFGNL